MKIVIFTPIVSRQQAELRQEQIQRASRLAQQFKLLGCHPDEIHITEPVWTTDPDLDTLGDYTVVPEVRALWRKLVLQHTSGDTEAIVFNFSRLGTAIPAHTLAVAYNAASSWDGVHLLTDPPALADHVMAHLLPQLFQDHLKPPPLLTAPADFITRKRLSQPLVAKPQRPPKPRRHRR